MSNEDSPAPTERSIVGVGTVRGAISGDVMIFRGIPYAAPPVGPRRFLPPQPADPWKGVRETRAIAPIAPQTPSRVYRHMGPISAPQDEDCLSITVWMPARGNGPFPVLVWLHGGGFLTGGGALPWYDGSELARQGLVVVGVNYRLGALGFLSVPEALPGNLAILDEHAALRWVKSHIADLRGDPDQVTVMGQSGGGHNIASLLTMESAATLFQRAILQSPPLGIGLIPAETARLRAEAFLDALGFEAGTPDLLEKLRDVPLSEILRAQTKAAMTLGKMEFGDLRPPFLPTALAPHEMGSDAFIDAAARGAAKCGIDVMIGWAREDANLFLAGHPLLAGITAENLCAVARGICGPDVGTMLAEVHQRRSDGSPAQLFFDLVTDLNFRLPSLDIASKIAKAGGRVFVYQFDWRSPDAQLGACHCIELPFMFGTLPAWRSAPLMAGADEAVTAPLSLDMVQRWAGFAKTGQPGFPAWHLERQPILHFDAQSWLEGNA
ncbi:MAG: carboxylesterase/lipase family protein [Steroidobacteraceae bacterium]